MAHFLTGIMYVLAMGSLFTGLAAACTNKFVDPATVMLPVVVDIFYMVCQSMEQENAASFANTMRMNILASVCTNVAFNLVNPGGSV